MLVWLRKFWRKLVGDPEHLSSEHRAFNVIAILTITLIAILIPLNTALRLWAISAMLVVVAAILVFLYIRSRIYGKYAFSLLVYAVSSYIVVAITFFYNGGSDGPALYLFLLTYLLLIAFTNLRFHRLWTILHLSIPLFLLGLEYLMPHRIIDPYSAPEYRYIDIATTFIIIIVCTYAITIYLRGNYEREKNKAEQHAREIELQHDQIRTQNRLLQKSNSEKLKLLSILAHDLRNPISAITGVLEILTHEELPEELQTKMKGQLLLAARNTSQLLENLLSWTSSQIKGLKPIFTKTRPSSIIDHVLNIQQFVAHQKNITIHTGIDENLIIWVDADMLELIIRNLVNNALKFTPKDGTVNISLARNDDEGCCTLAIADNGLGIASDNLKRLFEVNVKSTAGTDSEKGIGLGLFLCKELTTLNRGKIWVHSALGKGSTFFVSFPLTPPSPNS
ncbi:Signal transduction histidine kinase [Parapedobacter composti]|uniref:histidine kinase n=1 Tax=Parapedobacter composti TaxID=623281 RepID=A0A1I1I0P2_9SPHI|nr:HAMP domain-containing sensor histidine kinase [Parapedobacter composti]SFC26800.1 Signal transduction histidine kinase [Parapedobacter composti]